ncbi:MAG TPA: amidase, partial [Candidatus Handelsmanbacteria bacterium]|nr:amidase [Candidatus Handelsmanbacteria bacterium]
MNDSDICYLSAVELRRCFKSGELSPVEVAEATLRRIEGIDPKLNAYVTVTAERALAQARAAEAEYASGDPVPSLAGIPGSLKDLTVTKGIRTTRGSLLSADWVPDFDAPLARRLHQAG